MGELVPVHRVLRIMAVTAQGPAAIDWAAAQAESEWGAIALRSPIFDFRHTDYYAAEMGENLRKQLLAFAQLVDPGNLAADKRLTNEWESQYARQPSHNVTRPVNIDPGYLTEAKLVLASTKDRDHRIYLRDGIYAEVTLYFHRRQWQCSRWTYPDFQQPDYHVFLTECREYLRREFGRAV